jgi:hypothetical protein
MRAFTTACLIAVAVGMDTTAFAQESSDDLAKQLSNPISALISVPFQYNLDYGAGPNGNGVQHTLKIQPVIPIELNKDWTVISRTILPLTFADGIFADDVFGMGDATESLFLSPKDSGIEGVTWGLGPVFLLPSATDSRLGGGKLGIGPTGVALYQKDKWTVGVLASQVWSVAGDPNRNDVSQLFAQPFVSYALGGGQTLSANLEASYDWNAGQWSVPLNIGYSKVFKIGNQSMSFQIGAKKYLVTAPGGPDWGVRSTLTYLFPSQ